MGMGSRKRSVAWCLVVLVAGLLLAAAEADYCTKHCHGKVGLWRCVGRCRSQLEVAQQLSSFCGDYCRVEEPNVDYRYCVRRCETGPRRRSHHHLHFPAGAGGSSREEAREGAVDVLKVVDCERLCHDQPDQEWCLYRCLYRCYYGAYARRAPLHLKIAGVKLARQEEGSRRGEVLTSPPMPTCEMLCHRHSRVEYYDYEWCLRRCRSGGYARRGPLRLKLASGESTAAQEEEEASGGAIDVLTMTPEEICKLFSHDWPEHDACVELCMAGQEHLKLAGGESTTQEEEASGAAVSVHQVTAAAHQEAAEGARSMNTEDEDDKQERQKKDGEVLLGLGTGNIVMQ